MFFCELISNRDPDHNESNTNKKDSTKSAQIGLRVWLMSHRMWEWHFQLEIGNSDGKPKMGLVCFDHKGDTHVC